MSKLDELRELVGGALASLETPGSSSAPVVRYLRWQEDKGLYTMAALLDCIEAAKEMRAWCRKQMGPDGPEDAFDAALGKLEGKGS
jgi:hypothetical protein